MRLGDLDALKKAIEELEITEELVDYDCDDVSTTGVSQYLDRPDVLDIIDNAPTVEPTTKPMVEVKFDKDQMQELVDKAKAELLASVERPQSKWGQWVITEIRCPICLEYFQTDCYSMEELNECPSCGADMQKGGTE